MNKKTTVDKQPEEVTTPTTTFFVPGRGEVEARELADVSKQLKPLKEQEVGDGNR